MAPAGEEPPQLSDFQAETIRGTPGFVRVGRTRAGPWWLIGPDDRPFFACGVHRGADTVRLSRTGQTPAWGIDPLVVGDGNPPADWAGHWIAAIRFRPELPEAMIRLQGLSLPDVFAPDWGRDCREQAARACRVGQADARLIGWMPDPDLQWTQAGGLKRPTLLQVCLSLEPRFAAYHAAWEFVLAAHGGGLAALAASWVTKLPNKESLRLLTHEDQALGSAAYQLDDDRFTREFARLYFATVTSAIRAEDPGHLVIGLIPPGGPVPVLDGLTPLVDLLAVGVRTVVSRAHLVRVDGGSAREHTGLLTEINLGAQARRRTPRP